MKTPAALIVALLCGAVGCSLEPAPPKDIPPAPTPAEGSNRGRIGDSIRLEGGALAMRVSVVGVIDSVPVGPSDATVDPGARFVGVEIELENLGPDAYEGSPLGGASLRTDNGREADPVTLLDGPCAGGFASHVKIPPGQKRGGCLAFEVGPGRRANAFLFALDSGFAEEVGTWKLTKQPLAAPAP